MRGESKLKELKPYYFLYATGSGFLLAIAIGYWWQIELIWFYTAILTIFIVYKFFSVQNFLLLLFFVIGLFLGFSRWQYINILHFQQKEIFTFEQTTEFIGRIAGEVDVRTDRQLLTIIPVKETDKSDLKQKILVTTPLYPSYQSGDILKIRGEIKKPAVFSDFNYAAYLERFGVVAVMYYPTIKYFGQTDSIYSQLLKIKIRLIDQVNKLLPEPEASFLNGLLWGAKRAIPAKVLEQFNLTGTTHIVALSGYNITVLGLIVFFISPWLGLHRKVAFWLVLVIIILFIFLTGYPASVVRAGIMGILVLVAYRWGGGVKPGILLISSAAVMCAVNPYILLVDVGFQLSFLATIGLIYLVPWLEKFSSFLPIKIGIKESILATSAAIVMTTPLIIYQFGRFSVVALVVNILILFVIPLVMALGFLSVLVSLIFFPLGQLLAWLTYLGLHYIILVTEFFSQLPFASLFLVKPNVFLVITTYLIIFSFIFYAQRKTSALV
jgi:competence protein ComEC